MRGAEGGDPAPAVGLDVWAPPVDSLRPDGVDPIAYQASDSIVFEVKRERVALWGSAKVETAGIVLEAARRGLFGGRSGD